MLRDYVFGVSMNDPRNFDTITISVDSNLVDESVARALLVQLYGQLAEQAQLLAVRDT